MRVAAEGQNELPHCPAVLTPSEREYLPPASASAPLAARLDQFDETERTVLERDSVAGEILHRGAVQPLTPDERQVTTRLAARVITRAGLVRCRSWFLLFRCVRSASRVAEAAEHEGQNQDDDQYPKPHGHRGLLSVAAVR